MSFRPDQSILAGVATPTLQKWLGDAQQALADLMSGGKPVSVTITGGGQHCEITFAKTDSAALSNWIGLLQAQLGITQHRRRAIPVRF